MRSIKKRMKDVCKQHWLTSVLTLLGAGALWIMYNLGNFTIVRFLNEEGIEVIPFDMGFRWGSAVGMLGVMLIAAAIYRYVGYSKAYRYNILTAVILGIIAIMPGHVRLSSRLIMGFNTELDDIFLMNLQSNILMYVFIALVLIVAGMLLFGRLEGAMIIKLNKLISICLLVLAIIVLGMLGFSNMWYIILSAAFIILACIGIIFLSSRYEYDCQDTGILDILIFNFYDEDYDDEDYYDDEDIDDIKK